MIDSHFQNIAQAYDRIIRDSQSILAEFKTEIRLYTREWKPPTEDEDK